MREKARVFVDTDMGCDDIVALCMLLLWDDVALEGCTVVNGVAHIDSGVENLARVIALAGKQTIPIGMGSPTASSGVAGFPESVRTEADELSFLEQLLPSRLDVPMPPVYPAHELIAAYGSQHPGETTLICLGPLTNIARVIDVYGPQALAQFRRVVIMGGAFFSPGNVRVGPPWSGRSLTERYAEYNVFVDPVAAERVFSAPVDLVTVGLDVTRQLPIAECLERVRDVEARHPVARIAKQTLVCSTKIDYLYDPLTVAVATDLSVATQFERCGVRVNVNEEDERLGQTMVTGSGPVAVATHIHVPRFYDHLLRALSAPEGRIESG